MILSVDPVVSSQVHIEGRNKLCFDPFSDFSTTAHNLSSKYQTMLVNGAFCNSIGMNVTRKEGMRPVCVAVSN